MIDQLLHSYGTPTAAQSPIVRGGADPGFLDKLGSTFGDTALNLFRVSGEALASTVAGQLQRHNLAADVHRSSALGNNQPAPTQTVVATAGFGATAWIAIAIAVIGGIVLFREA